MKNKLFVFDWNGTLLSDTAASLKASNACLAFYGYPPITLARSREVFNFPILHFYKALGLSVDEVLAKKEESNEVFQKAYEHHARHARTRSGARQLLAWLQEEGAQSIILSNYLTAKIETHLARLNLRPYFAHISAYDCDGTTILHTTSKHERLETYMKQHNYAPENVVIIGDSTEEPALAKALGLTSIGITDGYISAKRLRAAKPDHIITHLGAVCKIF